MGKRNRKRLWIVIIVLFLLTSAFGLHYMIRIVRYKNKVNSVTFSHIDLQSVPDGSYTGEYDADIIGAKVEVIVQSGKITDIRLIEHKQERGAAAEAILDTILHEQKIDVDTVSGATMSSRVLKKAVENALTQS